MQNFDNPQQQPPQGGYGAPQQQPEKKKMSVGVKVFIIAVVAFVLVVGAIVLLFGVGGYLYYRTSKAQEVASKYRDAKTGLPAPGPSDAAGDDDAEPPQPTAEQLAAVSGGQSVEWSQQEITWTVPQRWKQDSASSTSFNWSSPGSWDAAHLLVNISPMGADFPVDVSIKAFHDAAVQRKANGEVDEVKWVKLGGLKGVMFRESAPEDASGSQRLQWMGYRNYKGQVQLVNIMLATQGKYFARHEDEMYGILYSTEF